MTATATAYGAGARTFHWLTALLVIAALAAGWTMGGMAFSPLKLRVVSWHKWAGITVLLLTVLRLLWRQRHVPPPLLPMPAWQRRAAQWLHGLLYLLLLLQPVLGWATTSAAGIPVVWFGVLPLPDFVPKDRALAEQLGHLHGLLGLLLSLLIVLHLLAALKHHFHDRDDTLRRMLPLPPASTTAGTP
jgi:cytochrome b561